MARRSYKFRLYPNKEQTANLERSLDLLRDLYNGAVQERRDAWKLNRIRVSCFDQINQVPDIRKLNSDYMAVHSRVCAQTLRQVDKAFQAFFRRAKAGQNPGYPRFKGKSFFTSFFYNQTGFRFVGNLIRLANIGLVKITVHRPIEGRLKQVTVKREGHKWYAIAICDDVPIEPLSECKQVVGVDVGIESFATLSDGTQIENLRYYESAQKKLRVAQRRVARSKKGSNRRRKAIAQLRLIHQKIFNQRHDFQHKLSYWLIQNYGIIAVEKLNIAGLAKGRLSKQVTDAGWYGFINKLKYKAESAGRQLIEVCPNFTSQDCSGCGTRVKKGLSVRVHNCENCGLSIHRDWNAALNILSRSRRDQSLTKAVGL